MSDQNNSNAQQVQQRTGGGPAVTKGTIKTAKRLWSMWSAHIRCSSLLY